MTAPWRPPDRPGDRSPDIPNAKRALRKYSYGQGLGETDEYTVAFGVALRQFQRNRNAQILAGTVRDMPGMNIDGRLDWATKKNLGILPEQINPPRNLPVCFTVAGHRGDMFDGPAYFTARWLEERGLVRVQPVGYNNFALPFDVHSGVAEINDLANNPRVLPPGTDFVWLSHSLGSIVTSVWWRDIVSRERHRWPYDHFKGGLEFGPPMRPTGAVAPWVFDPPPPNSQGLAHDCLPAAADGVQYVARDGDFYTNKKVPVDAAGEYMVAIYKAVTGAGIGGTDGLAEQIWEIVASGGMELWYVFEAISRGVVGLTQLSEHGDFDLGPCIDYIRRILRV